MTTENQHLRIRCLELAVESSAGLPSNHVLSTAEKYVAFVQQDAPPPKPEKKLLSYRGIVHLINEGYLVNFPEFPKCSTSAPSLDLASLAASNALQIHIDQITEEGEHIKYPHSLNYLRENYKDVFSGNAGIIFADVMVPVSALKTE